MKTKTCIVFLFVLFLPSLAGAITTQTFSLSGLTPNAEYDLSMSVTATPGFSFSLWSSTMDTARNLVGTGSAVSVVSPAVRADASGTMTVVLSSEWSVSATGVTATPTPVTWHSFMFALAGTLSAAVLWAAVSNF